MEEYKQSFAQKLAQSSAAAAILVILGFGLYAYLQTGQPVNIWMLTVAVIVGAVAYVGASTYMDLRGYHYQSAIVTGGIAAVSFFALTLSVEFIAVFVTGNGVTPTLVSYLALFFGLAIILSSSAIWIIQGKANEDYYG